MTPPNRGQTASRRVGEFRLEEFPPEEPSHERAAAIDERAAAIDERAVVNRPAERAAVANHAVASVALRVPRSTHRRAVLVAVSGIAALAVFALAWFRPTVASAVPRNGILAVESEPNGAAVVVDGEPRGTTPASLTLPVGSHRLLVRRGERSQELSVTVVQNASVVHHFTWPSEPAKTIGNLRIISEGSQGSVTVDGVRRGRTPLSVNGLTAGDHDVAVSLDGNIDRQRIRVEPGATVSLVVGRAATTAGLQSGWLSTKADVSLQIFEDGKLVGSTESERILMPAGEHAFEFANAALGFSVSKNVKIVAGKTESVAIDLPRASININATPWAQVWLDGQAVGDTPIGNLTTTIGPHEVVFRHPQLGERRVTALVTLKAPARVAVDMNTSR